MTTPSQSFPDEFHDNRIQWTISWFREWHHRDDHHEKSQFFRMLAHKLAPASVDTVFDSMHTLTLTDTPKSIFQIRLSLCSEWYDKFTPEQRQYLFSQLEHVDPEFMAKLKNLGNESHS